MIIPPAPVRIRPNRTAKLSCLAWSYGGIVYKWNSNDSSTLPSNNSAFFQDQPLPANANHITTVHKLWIFNVQTRDEGLYCCEASNERGSITECAWLEVDSKLVATTNVFVS